MDQVTEYIKEMAEKESGITKLILFGSRARGNHHLRSDYDVAVETKVEIGPAEWSRWALQVREHVPTLCGLDLVHLTDETANDLKEAIAKEGKVFYERK
jgi:uncharacterized protein